MIDVSIFNMEKLVENLLGIDWATPGNKWREDCEVIPDYRRPLGGDATLCVVRHIPSGSFLRYSKGPHQGHGWDIYGDDYQTPEMAVIALSQAPPPSVVVRYQ